MRKIRIYVNAVKDAPVVEGDTSTTSAGTPVDV
jgi:hypothetical protein